MRENKGSIVCSPKWHPDNFFSCVTQLKLYTLYKLSSTIFCCLYVREGSVSPAQISTFSIYTGIRALYLVMLGLVYMFLEILLAASRNIFIHLFLIWIICHKSFVGCIIFVVFLIASRLFGIEEARIGTRVIECLYKLYDYRDCTCYIYSTYYF